MESRSVTTPTQTELGKRRKSTTSEETAWQPPPNTEESQEIPRRIHILGLGSIGRLVAHSLRSLPDAPPITLVFHRGSAYRSWEDGSKEIRITTNGITVARSGFDAELQRVGFRRHGKSVTAEEYFFPTSGGHSPQNPLSGLEGDALSGLGGAKADDIELPDRENTSPIDNLIITVKAPQTVGALLAVKNRLGPNSTILFLQNGIGMVDQVDKEIFPDPATRPQYMVGIISHGVHSHPSKDSIEATHAGMGTISLGLPLRNPTGLSSSNNSDSNEMSPSSRYLLRTVCRSPVLSAVALSPIELLQMQLEKLAINCVINPMTVLIDCRNGGLLYNYAFTRAMRLLLAEISLVIRSLPEVQHLPNVSTRFSTERLETRVVAVANSTANNISSMLADIRGSRRTEIQYINGYIVKRGEELGISCFMNYLIMQLVIGKQQMIDKERNAELPFPKLRSER